MGPAWRECPTPGTHCPVTIYPLLCLKVLSKAPRSFQAGECRAIKVPKGTPQQSGEGSQWINACPLFLWTDNPEAHYLIASCPQWEPSQ